MSLRARLTAGALAGATIALAVLVLAFNLVLDAHLRSDADNVLRERAATVLRGLGTVDGRLSVIEAPDQGAIDTQTWIFAGSRTLEQPAGADPRNQSAARRLAAAGAGLTTVEATDTRLQAVLARQGSRPLGTIVVGASLAPYESTASSALLGSIILGALVLLAVAALSLWLISRALRPVAQITAQAAAWEEHDLSRRLYAGEPHDELSTLASVFDSLLSRLAQSLRHEQRLTAEISHELRTPLAKILTEAELASSRKRSTQDYRRSLHAITTHAQDLQRVLETLLASARAETSTRPGMSDARLCAERAISHVRETPGARGKEIGLACARPARVAVEADVLERILSPLLENAARYARKRLTLTVRTLGAEVIFEVADDGPGIDPDDRERIFQPGYRDGSPQAREHPGAGLGLALVRRLARAAGGDVEALVSSGGARIAVRLPSAGAGDASARARAAHPSAVTGPSRSAR